MVKKHWGLVLVAGVLATGAVGVLAQQPRGNSGLPSGQGNPLASLQQQIDALAQQVAGLSNGTPVQGGAESDLFVIRGTISGAPAEAGGGALEGAGFTVTTNLTLPCGSPNRAREYHVTFDPPFSSTPSVVVSARDFLFAPFDPVGNGGDRPVYTAAIYNGSGGVGVTPYGFTVRIKTDAFSETCFGSQNWDFIAIGPGFVG